MIKVKDSESKVISGKRTITFDNVTISDEGFLVDENGLIGEQLKPELPPNVDTFKFKIQFDLDDEAEDIVDSEEPEDTDEPDGYNGLPF